jgi:hypothetical protein
MPGRTPRGAVGASLATGQEHAAGRSATSSGTTRCAWGPTPDGGFHVEGTAWLSVELEERRGAGRAKRPGPLRTPGASPGG